MKIFAILPAAGCGSRAGFERNKILQPIDGVPVLARSLSAFSQNSLIDGIVVCTNKADRDEISRIASAFANVRIAEGGDTRTQSVRNALESLAQDAPDYVLIHDAARPFVSQQIIENCIKTVRSFGSAVCALPCTDTLVSAQCDIVCGTLERESTFLVQTPQGFAYAELLSAYRKIGKDDRFTDDSGVYAKYVAPPHLFYGEAQNKKLTFREDFSMPDMRTGIGVDTHAFGTEATFITLGGVRIPSDRGLIAHSDGDVLCHAVMDALLSAAGLLDIGHYFPDSDPQYKDADSLALLANVSQRIRQEGFAVGNVSAAIVAQKPKLAPFIPEMKQNVANVLHIFEQNVGISAGTSEGLGAIGRGEGICVTASVLLRSLG